MTDADKTAARNEIAELMQRYAEASDSGDRDAYALCYTPDGVLDLPGGVEHRGHAALRDMPKPENIRRRHYFLPPILEFKGDGEADGRGYCIVFNFDREKRAAAAPGSVDYKTSFRKTPEGWRIGRHAVRMSFAD